MLTNNTCYRVKNLLLPPHRCSTSWPSTTTGPTNSRLKILSTGSKYKMFSWMFCKLMTEIKQSRSLGIGIRKKGKWIWGWLLWIRIWIRWMEIWRPNRFFYYIARLRLWSRNSSFWICVLWDIVQMIMKLSWKISSKMGQIALSANPWIWII